MNLCCLLLKNNINIQQQKWAMKQFMWVFEHRQNSHVTCVVYMIWLYLDHLKNTPRKLHHFRANLKQMTSSLKKLNFELIQWIDE